MAEGWGSSEAAGTHWLVAPKPYTHYSGRLPASLASKVIKWPVDGWGRVGVGRTGGVVYCTIYRSREGLWLEPCVLGPSEVYNIGPRSVH